MIIVVKIGTSSLTDELGRIRGEVIERLSAEVAGLRSAGQQVVLVTSGAISAGLPALGLAEPRPKDARTLQAVSAVGQSHLMAQYGAALDKYGLVVGQVLLAPGDFFERKQYLHARGTLERLLELGVVPIINENDAVADDAIRFGDNDRIAALVAQLIGADRLILLTDQNGVYTADPRTNDDAQLIAELDDISDDFLATIGGAGTERGSGGMMSKVGAARMAAAAGVTTVIASAEITDVLERCASGQPGVGTLVHPATETMSAKKLWIAFAVEPRGTVTVDAGAAKAIRERGRSLLAVGAVDVGGSFDAGDAIDIIDHDTGTVLARGLAAVSASDARSMAGFRTDELPDGLSREIVHRNDLVVIAR